MKHNFVTCLKLLRGSGGGLYIDISKTQKFTEIYIFLSSNILMQITDQRLLSLHLHKVKLNYPRGQILIAPLKSLLSLYKQRRSQIRARAPVTLEGKMLLPTPSSSQITATRAWSGSWGRTVLTE